jgi:hypothetical protein
VADVGDFGEESVVVVERNFKW